MLYGEGAEQISKSFPRIYLSRNTADTFSQSQDDPQLFRELVSRALQAACK